VKQPGVTKQYSGR